MPYKKTKQCPICGKPIYPFSEFCRKHVPMTEEHKSNIRKALKGKKHPWWQGGEHKPETKVKIKASWTEERREQARQKLLKKSEDKEWLEHLSILFSGDRNPQWRDGIAQKPYIGFYRTLKAKIRKRDNYTCQLCIKTEEELSYKLSIHHIDYNKENPDEDNLISLCKRCNSLVNLGREDWTVYFKSRVSCRLT